MLAIASVAQAAAQSLEDATPVYKSGVWTVLRTVNQMSDATVCTGIYKDNYGIQLTGDKLYINVKGGISSVTLRFGEDAAKPLRLATEIEKKIGSLILEGSDFYEAMRSTRLRMQVGTLVRGIETIDLELTGIDPTVANIGSGCPIGEGAHAPGAAQKRKPKSQCTKELIARMKKQGIGADQIEAICAE
jgi:hypothetical protein